MIEELKALAEKLAWAVEARNVAQTSFERDKANAAIAESVAENLPAILSALSAVPVMKEALEAVRSDAQSAIDLYGKHGAAFTSPKTGNEYEPANYVQDKMAEFVGIARQALAALERK